MTGVVFNGLTPWFLRTPVLKELHWLPVRKRIDHKIMSLAYKRYEGRHRSTCTNSFRGIFLHDPFARHLIHAYGYQALLKNTPKSSLVSELSLSLPPSSGMPYHKQSGKQIPLRRSADVWKLTCFLTDFSFSVSAGLTVHRNFWMSSQDFFLSIFYL